MARKQIKTQDDLKTATMALDNTSKKIRYLAAQGKSVKEIYKLINEWGVSTKSGGEIRYQHVRNTVMMKLSGE